MNIETILDASLGPLEFDAIAPLFDWPGELLYGDEGRAIATDEPDTLPGKPYEEFGYRLTNRGELPFPDRDLVSPGPAPQLPAKELRDRLLIDRPPQQETQEAGFARPGKAAAFQAQQQLLRCGDRPIPVYPIPDFFREPVEGWEIEPDPGASTDGVEWACESLSQTVMEMKLLPRLVIDRLGVGGSAQVLRSHLLSTSADALEAVRLFERYDFAGMATAAEEKRLRIAKTCQKLIEVARIPVVDAEGKVMKSLTVVNQLTCAIAVRQLWAMTEQIQAFRSGVAALLYELSGYVVDPGRNEALNALVAQGQELGMGYD
jgi:hypothetical protein